MANRAGVLGMCADTAVVTSRSRDTWSKKENAIAYIQYIDNIKTWTVLSDGKER